ncbi:P-loop containing nucleoside triphosphate hydrolase protein [Fimicolochytrium jonesii]|uniref:P-loop containing nucleoside triphosphate hydrolase protein n=1 Tax=Fimicolochytrium jonesii TaxID=1396493 RepID=UPI0022FEAA54|nr:P-loop containing nucleoside triphosphate hydrolase protein [Fimicolochytrium jonesii]KAI8818954.1 P-loop containing nucleoside triphosphate hydrolase protein [Fimicolochytrium jonesii]
MNLSPEEFNKSVENIRKALTPQNADVTVLHQRNSLTTSSNGSTSQSTDSSSPYVYGHVLIRRKPGKVEDMMEIRICVVGNVDAGKSTLLGVLTKDVLDDGRGKARVNLFRHKHEIESGRTSSVGLEIMGFSSTGETITPSLLGKAKLTWDDICSTAPKVLTFLDLAGHEKYLKTTVFGMTGSSPDFVMLMIGSNAGIIGMTKEHLGLALALNVPVFIVITKIDMCPKNVLEGTINQLTKILKSSGCRKIPIFLNTVGDVLVTAGNFVSERVCPIFQVSNVTGDGLDLLKLFLNVLHANSAGRYDSKQPVEFDITDTFSVPGVGTVVSGTIITGSVHVGDQLMLGPDSNGHFVPTMIKSIQRKRVNVPIALAGQSASFALKKVKRSSIRKGMVMLSKTVHANAVYEFEAEILVLYHSTTISKKYQAMLHCGPVRQTAKILTMDQQILRTGDRAFVRFRFIQHPEYLKIGSRLLFREGRTKGVGKVTRLFTESEVAVQHALSKGVTHDKHKGQAPVAPGAITSTATNPDGRKARRKFNNRTDPPPPYTEKS